jgi:hypothetical protein
VKLAEKGEAVGSKEWYPELAKALEQKLRQDMKPFYEAYQDKKAIK